jgi:hypothetical protein
LRFELSPEEIEIYDPSPHMGGGWVLLVKKKAVIVLFARITREGTGRRTKAFRLFFNESVKCCGTYFVVLFVGDWPKNTPRDCGNAA